MNRSELTSDFEIAAMAFRKPIAIYNAFPMWIKALFGLLWLIQTLFFFGINPFWGIRILFLQILILTPLFSFVNDRNFKRLIIPAFMIGALMTIIWVALDVYYLFIKVLTGGIENWFIKAFLISSIAYVYLLVVWREHSKDCEKTSMRLHYVLALYALFSVLIGGMLLYVNDDLVSSALSQKKDIGDDFPSFDLVNILLRPTILLICVIGSLSLRAAIKAILKKKT